MPQQSACTTGTARESGLVARSYDEGNADGVTGLYRISYRIPLKSTPVGRSKRIELPTAFVTLARVLPSNATERTSLFDLFGLIRILETSEHKGFFSVFTGADQWNPGEVHERVARELESAIRELKTEADWFRAAGLSQGLNAIGAPERGSSLTEVVF